VGEWNSLSDGGERDNLPAVKVYKVKADVTRNTEVVSDHHDHVDW